MRSFTATIVVALSAVFLAGCATKKYVRETAAPIQAKVDQVGDQTVKQGQAIEETRGEVKAVDERASSGISAAKERAMTADARANEALGVGKDALTKAGQASEAAQKNAQELSGLRQVVANLDDYKLQAETSVPFRFNQHRLSDEARQELDKLVADKGKFKRYFIAVEGYTDRSGTAEYNAMLSRRRADSVVQYLVAQHDIPIYRIHMIGLGEQRPAEEGATRAARAKNRRVEVKVFSADQSATVSRLQ
ncbi:MAG: OmpA family protein [Acidobacteria bacterium]|nr:OmpA family protein [Acidobacteriota bacterium]